MSHAAKSWQGNYWRNTAANYLCMLTRIGSGLVLFRMLFQGLSHEQFGYYALLWSLFGYAILLDFGLGVAVQKAVAEKSGPNDIAALNRLIATVFWSFAAMGVFLFIVLALAKPLFLSGVKIDPANRAEFGAAYLVFMAALGVNFPLALFPEVLRGVQRIDLANWAVIGAVVGNLLVMMCGLWLHWSFPLLVFVSVASTISHELAALIISKRLLPNLSIHPRHFHFGSIRGVLGFSLAAYLITFTNMVILKADQALLGFTLGVGCVALYQVGYKAADVFGNFTRQLHDALSPAAAHLGAAGNSAALRELLLSTTRITFLITTPLYALCAAYLAPVILLLSGMKSVDAATFQVGQILLLATYSTLLTNSCTKRIMVMCGWERPLLKLSVAEAALNFILSLVLVWKIGIVGVAIGTLVPALLIGWFGLIPIAARFAELSVPALLREFFMPVLLPVAASLLVLAALLILFPIPSGAHFFACVWRGALVLAPVAALGAPKLRKRRIEQPPLTAAEVSP